MINHPHRSKRAISASPSPKVARAAPAQIHDRDWSVWLARVRDTFRVRAANGPPLFQTDAGDLNAIYLKAFKVRSERQVHDCHACRTFLRNFGGLVTIDAEGNTTSAMWNALDMPPAYAPVARVLRNAVIAAKVTGPFLSDEATWGTPSTPGYTHFAVPSPKVYRHALLSAGQAMAAMRANFETVETALKEIAPKTIAEALRLLEADHLSRSEKFTAPLHWLANLHDMRTGAGRANRDNVLWRAVATAPEGYMHPRAAVTDSLLEDLAAGMSFDTVKKRWEAKTHPLKYQRPQAAPKAGTIAQAEKTFEQMGLAPALERRFARLDEVQTAWVPYGHATYRRARQDGKGVFSHIVARKDPRRPVRASGTPEAVMTWEKFARTVLPAAEAIEARVEARVEDRMSFIALTTAVHDDAPSILKWDRDDERNPFAWYVYHNGSSASQWGLSTGWTKVTGIVPLPPMWGSEPQPHLGEGFVIVLEGCADTRGDQGNALFPECLRGELHGVRSVIEAHSRGAVMQGRAGASANGLDIRKGAKVLGVRLRVTVDGLWTDYRLDRWD